MPLGVLRCRPSSLAAANRYLCSGPDHPAGTGRAGIVARHTDHRVGKTSGLANTREPLVRDFKITRDRQGLADRFQRAEPPQWPVRTAENSLHPRIRHRDDIRELAQQSEFDHAVEKLESCSRDAAPGPFGPRPEIDAESAAFPDRVARWRRFAIQEHRKGLAQHGGPDGRQKPHAPLNAAVVFLQKMRGPACIEFIDFHVVADLHVPAETFLENAVAEPVHFGEVGK